MSPAKLVLSVSLLLVAVSPALAEPPSSNILFGELPSDITLTVAAPGPVYYVPGDLTVPEGRTLTVEPGVTVLVAAARDTLGTGNPLQTELLLRGTLAAVGTLEDSIRIVPTDTQPYAWRIDLSDAGAAT